MKLTKKRIKHILYRYTYRCFYYDNIRYFNSNLFMKSTNKEKTAFILGIAAGLIFAMILNWCFNV